MEWFKFLKISSGITAMSLLLVTCSNDDSPSVNPQAGQVNIAVSASVPGLLTPASGLQGKAIADAVEISSFMVNFQEIEFERAGDDDRYNSDDDEELRGPFTLELVNENPVHILSVVLPNGTYEEAEFELKPNTQPSSDLQDKSIQIKGEVNGTPFVYWSNFEGDVEIDYEDTNKNLIVDNNSVDLTINFDLTNVLLDNPNIDLSSANDGDGDGGIEIGPDNVDGNQALANAITQALAQHIDLEDHDFEVE